MDTLTNFFGEPIPEHIQEEVNKQHKTLLKAVDALYFIVDNLNFDNNEQLHQWIDAVLKTRE